MGRVNLLAEELARLVGAQRGELEAREAPGALGSLQGGGEPFRALPGPHRHRGEDRCRGRAPL